MSSEKTPRKLIWLSNSPQLGSGYGTQTKVFTRIMKRDGIADPTIFGIYGHHGPSLWGEDGIRVLPMSQDGTGADMLAEHYTRIGAEMCVILYDLWAYPQHVLESVPVTSWCPVDTDPIAPLLGERLRSARHVWAMSRHGERMIRDMGISPDYVPHGIDTNLYKPVDRDTARQRQKIEDGQFFAVMVAANKGYPDRKGFSSVFPAWAEFIKTHPDAVLYIHTIATEEWGGLNLAEMAEFYGISQNVRFVGRYGFLNNLYTDADMAALYSAADVLLAPSRGEGFGLPVVEGMSCGLPAIVSDFTAQSELVGPGYKVPIYEDDKVYAPLGGRQAVARPSEIVTALEWAYEHMGDDTLRDQCREFALEYDAEKVWRQYMRPAIEKQVDLIEAREARTAARVAMRNIPTPDSELTSPPTPLHCGEGSKTACEHEWSESAKLDDDGATYTPCKKPGCGAALKRLPEGHDTVVEDYFTPVDAGVPSDDGDTKDVKPITEPSRNGNGHAAYQALREKHILAENMQAVREATKAMEDKRKGVCIAFMCQDDAHWLRLHLPVWKEAGLDMMALDGGSKDDTVAYLESQGVTVHHHPFEHDYAAQANRLLDYAQKAGYAALIRLDPDELMFPDDIKLLAQNIVSHFPNQPDVIALPRINFAENRAQHQPQHYPDPQVRAMRLGVGIRYQNPVHEAVYVPSRKLDAVRDGSCEIFHYGMIEDLKLRSLQFYNYERIAAGLPLVESYEDVPEDKRMTEYPPRVPFDRPQPLDPAVIGLRAPFEVVSNES